MIVDIMYIYNERVANGTYLTLYNYYFRRPEKLTALHYLNLVGIDYRILSKEFQRIKTINISGDINEKMIQYLKLTSQDIECDYNEYDDKIEENLANEQSIQLNEWKNRFV